MSGTSGKNSTMGFGCARNVRSGDDMSERRWVRFIIKGEFPSLNEYILAERGSGGKYRANHMKQYAQQSIKWQIKAQMKNIKYNFLPDFPVDVHCVWYCKDKRKDPDNIRAIGTKFLLDSFVDCGVLVNDGWGQITSFKDTFFVDKDNPRVEITLMESEYNE